MELLLDPHAWLAFVTLATLEIVLGIDNIVFISILVSRLPVAQQRRARLVGLSLAMVMRIGLLLSLVWVMQLTEPLFSVFKNTFSGRDLILIVGGGFLLAKSTLEIHGSLEGEENEQRVRKSGFTAMMIQIALIDIVFSLDSVITAVGLVQEVEIMIAAIIVAVLVMMVAAGPIGRFVDTHPTIKMLALSFLMMIGIALIAEGFKFHIPKGYLYFAMAFSLGVEMLNLRVRRSAAQTLRLRKRHRVHDA